MGDLPELQTPNIMGQFAQGYQFGTGIRQQRAGLAAGKLAAAGNYAGATTTALSSGDTDLAAKYMQLSASQRAVHDKYLQDAGKAAYVGAKAPDQELPAALANVVKIAHDNGIPQEEIQGKLQGINMQDPNSIRSALSQFAKSTMDFGDIIGQDWKEKEFGLKQQSTQNDTLTLQNTMRHQGVEEGQAAANLAETKNWHQQTLGGNTPVAAAFRNFMQSNPDATPEQQAKFLQSSSTRPRSAQTMALQKFLDENPNATSDDITSFAADMKAKGAAVSAFGSGTLGSNVRSANVAIQHLGQLSELSDALNNRDNQSINKASQIIQAWSGDPDPTNFNTVKELALDEVAKFVVGGNFTQGDRESLKESISQASSPAQLKGTIDHLKGLMAGQMIGYQKQYQDSTRRNDFDSKLLPETIAEMKKHGYDAAPGDSTIPAETSSVPQQSNTMPRVQSDADYNALPSGAKYLAPDGSVRTKR